MSRLTRREMLEQSMLAAAAAVGVGATSRILADDAPAAKSANEELQIAVIGVNGRGSGHLAELAGREGVVVACVCDADEAVGQSRAADTAARQNGRKPRFVRDMREVFDDPSIDAVTTATPNHWHALCSIWAMQAGKDVYVEKPVSHNVSEGRRIVETARAHGKICQTGTQCRSCAGTQEAIAFVRAGGIGNLRVARGLCYKRRGSIGPRGEYPVPASVDYGLWLGPALMAPVTRPNFHYDWHWQWDYGNGDLGNQGIHQMDLARWGLGADTVSRGVVSYGGRLAYEDAGDTANTQVVVHDYGDKSLVFEVRGLPTDTLRGAGVGVIFEGTDGYLVLNSYEGGAAFDTNGNMIRSFAGGGDHMGNFLAAVRSRRTGDLAADILEGHLSSALCHLGNISYRLGANVPLAEAESRLAANSETAETFDRFKRHLADNGLPLDATPIQFGRQLQIDPATEHFVGSPDADSLLSRDYRSPFVVPASGQV